MAKVQHHHYHGHRPGYPTPGLAAAPVLPNNTNVHHGAFTSRYNEVRAQLKCPSLPTDSEPNLTDSEAKPSLDDLDQSSLDDCTLESNENNNNESVVSIESHPLSSSSSTSESRAEEPRAGLDSSGEAGGGAFPGTPARSAGSGGSDASSPIGALMERFKENLTQIDSSLWPDC